MANTTRSHGHPRRDDRATGGDDDAGPRVMVRDMGFPGAGWAMVDGEPVVVIDQSMSELDRRRFLVAIVDDLRTVAYRCPVCGAVSYHPDDIAQGYCGRCHAFTGDGAADA